MKKRNCADEEVTISYTGPEGYTNQRMMAQYGFVVEGGNPADRIPYGFHASSIAAMRRCPTHDACMQKPRHVKFSVA